MIDEESLALHYKVRGKIGIESRVSAQNAHDLSLVYTPGVASACLEIEKDVNLSYELTRRNNLVAVITDGTAVLGLGDIGPEAGMPVMEGKCVLFKSFADVDAFPICIRSKDVDTIVDTIYNISGSFGGINLEDISAPRCFEIEKRLRERCDIPVLHDDQHGTAVVVLAATLNALKIVKKELKDVSAVCCGAGAAGIAIVKLLMTMGLKDVIMCDIDGAIYEGRENLSQIQKEMAAITNRNKIKGSLADAIKGKDIFIGVSAANVLKPEMIQMMAQDPIIFAMANPSPEIMPDVAKEAGAAIIGTGRSDFSNQINNVLAFPGIFRGALDVRASTINEEMEIAAAKAISSLVTEEELSKEYILPKAYDRRVAAVVAEAVKKAAKDTGVNRI